MDIVAWAVSHPVAKLALNAMLWFGIVLSLWVAVSFVRETRGTR